MASSADQGTSLRRSSRTVVVKSRHLSLYAEESDTDDKENSQVAPHEKASQEGSSLNEEPEKPVQRSKKRAALDSDGSSCSRDVAGSQEAGRHEPRRKPSLALCVKKFGGENHDLTFDK